MTGRGASAGLSLTLVSAALVSAGVAVGVWEVGLCEVDEESCPAAFVSLLVSLEEVSLAGESSGALLFAVASGVEPALGSGCCWAIPEGAKNNADNATVPSTSRNFITHSCPKPRAPHEKHYTPVWWKNS